MVFAPVGQRNGRRAVTHQNVFENFFPRLEPGTRTHGLGPPEKNAYGEYHPHRA